MLYAHFSTVEKCPRFPAPGWSLPDAEARHNDENLALAVNPAGDLVGQILSYPEVSSKSIRLLINFSIVPLKDECCVVRRG
jgi:hypothetical protein